MRISPTRTVALGLAGALTLSSALTLGATTGPATGAAALGATGPISTVPTGDFPTALETSADGSLLYVAERYNDRVLILNTSDFSTVGSVDVAEEPTALSLNPSGDELWVSSFTGGAITIIDTATQSVADTISTGGWPRGIDFSTDGATAYVANQQQSSLHVIDTATRAVTRTVGTGTLGIPTDVIISDDESTAIVSASNFDALLYVNTVTGAFVWGDSTPTGDFPLDLELSPDGTQYWVSNNAESGDGTVTVVDVATRTSTGDLVVGSNPAEIDYSADGTLGFVSVGGAARLVVIDTTTLDTLDIVLLDHESQGLAAIGDRTVAVAHGYHDELAVVTFADDTPPAELSIDRLSGPNRYATAVAISQEAFPGGASVVYVASGANFPDALAAGPAASKEAGALLMTDPNSLPTDVRDEIERLGVSRIVVVVGTGVVSNAVFEQLRDIEPNIERVSGASRYETARLVVDAAWQGQEVERLFVATASNYPDALSAGAVGAAYDLPVVLVDGSATSVPNATLALIADLNPEFIHVVGGTAVVSSAIATQLENEFGGVTRLAGSDRYATSAAINEAMFATMPTVIWATGAGFPDALAGAALASAVTGPVQLVAPNCVQPAALTHLDERLTEQLYLLGGTASLSKNVAALTSC